MNNKIIFAGLVLKVPNCGISMKNFFFIKKFQEYYDKVYVVDLHIYGLHKLLLPFDIFRIVLWACLYPKAKIVVSSNTWESNILFKVLVFLGMAKRCFFWVPGGVFPKMVKDKKMISTFIGLKKLYVQSPSMVQSLQKMGFSNAIYVPNSKEINYYPVKPVRNDGIIRFVFLSRIHPSKGCGMIINCAKRLNELGYADRFIIDFYGNFFLVYKEKFLALCDTVPNVRYQGFINLTLQEGYDKLAGYDMMLFPTYWHGEGFPGVVIDAYIAGLPIIASDWNCNCDVVDDTTGIIIKSQNEDALFEEMKNTIDGKYDLVALSKACQERAKLYDNDYVLSKDNLIKIGLW